MTWCTLFVMSRLMLFDEECACLLQLQTAGRFEGRYERSILGIATSKVRYERGSWPYYERNDRNDRTLY